MANYKPVSGGSVLLNPQYSIEKSGRQLIVLYMNAPMSTSADSITNMTDGTVYIVATGKTFTLIEIIAQGGTAAGNILVYEGATDNATTTFKGQINSIISTDIKHIPFNSTFAADKYVTMKNGTNCCGLLIAIGYEE